MYLQALSRHFAFLALAITYVSASTTTSCSSLQGSVPTPSVASGYAATLVATGLSSPRGAIFDASGHLLVVERGKGVTALTFDGAGQAGCVVENEGKRKAVVEYEDLNHGITLSPDGKTLYASSPEAAWSWPYDPSSASTTGANTTLVDGMTTSDHTTRTLLLPQSMPGHLIITRGSTSNVDLLAEDLSSGHSQIKMFDLTGGGTPFDFNTAGTLLGWGLRNDVGIDEEPIGGGLYAVENSVDQLRRYGSDIHENNPGEKLNFLGLANDTSRSPEDINYGYPACFAAWDPSDVPRFDGQVGQQFVSGYQNKTNTDELCQTNHVAPRLVFQAHMAPLSIKFNTAGSQAWVTFHGSWDRTDPAGYKVSTLAFANGSPVEPSNSTIALMDIVANQDTSSCPDSCFRPVALAFDSLGRLFFTSDATGEVYMITSADEKSPSVQSSSTASPTASPSPTNSPGAASMVTVGSTSWLVCLAGIVLANLGLV